MEERIETTIKEDPVTKERYITDAWSEDGLCYWSVDVRDQIGISCAQSGLRDNTAGNTDRHFVNLLYPGMEVPEELLDRAQRFNETVQVARDELRREQEEERGND